MSEADYANVATLTAIRCAAEALRWACPDEEGDQATLDEVLRLIATLRMRFEGCLADDPA